MGAPNKISGNKISGIKVLKKINPKKKEQRKKSWKYGNMVSDFDIKNLFYRTLYPNISLILPHFIP